MGPIEILEDELSDLQVAVFNHDLGYTQMRECELREARERIEEIEQQLEELR